MCGIAGCVVLPGSRPDRAALERMASALGHRGPDDRGIEVIGSVGLVQTRLAIVDPSPSGHAPMPGPGERWWLTYNGEVFNHAELRSRLGNVAWRGGSDTETLVHALDCWGEDAISQCNGLFAFAALDTQRGRLLLVRDRFGVKPLYAASHGGALWFASEIRALLAAGVPAHPRVDVLRHVVAYGWANGRQTPLEGVDVVLPGTVVSVDVETLEMQERAWYRPAEAVDPERAAALARRPRAELAAEVERELRASVRRRLMADVPLGTMCSGGVDSSLVTAFARDEQPGIVAYNAAVPDQPAADEGPWARRVAEGLGVELRTVDMTAQRWREGLVEAVAHNELPLMHESSVPMAMIAARAREDGVKVLLSGEGADGLFGGYDFLHHAEYAAFLGPGAQRRQRLEAVRARVAGLVLRRGRGLLSGARRRLERGRPSALTDPPPAGAAVEFHAAVGAASAAAYAHHPGERGALEAQLLSDLSVYLPHLLNRQDKNTMQRSIETRVPFLDPGVVALAVNLPLEVRVTPLRKGVLRDLAAQHLPPEIARRKKVGFGFDVRAYLGDATRPEFLADGRLRDVLGFTREEWAGAIAGFAPDRALRAWTGEVWCRLFLEGEAGAAVDAELWG